MQLILQKRDPADILWLDEFLDINALEIISEDISTLVEKNNPVLHFGEGGLSMLSGEDQTAKPTQVDFLSSKLQHRVATSNRSKGLLKAIGLDKAKTPLTVIDATAGLGVDAYMLASSGCQVCMLEKSGFMAALLHDGIQRGLLSGTEGIRQHLTNMTLIMVDAHEYLSRLKEKPDVIYLDPMFPLKQKSAKVKKDMALMQQLLPPNEDIEQLLELACTSAGKRVVLKRPGKNQKQPQPMPDFQVPGRACHFQVFLTA